MRSTSAPQYRWKVELRASTIPVEEWVEMRVATTGIGKRYRFVEHGEAEAAVTALKKIQPHAVLRIAPM